ncbi:MAG: 5'-methylthioadenosine/adenosylhomocysteine nucleosidase [Butyricicoccaceae bacterium]
MVWGILGALDAEVALIRDKMDIAETTEMFGTTYYQGTVYGQQVVLVCCGVGKVNAAVCAATAVSKFGAECIVNVGIAGAMRPGLKIMDVVISEQVAFHDQDRIMLDYYPKCEFFQADEALRTLCLTACAEIPALEHRVHTGLIISGDQFINDAAVKKQLNERYAPAATEMEGAAIGHAAFMFGVPFLVIRTMSDAADDDADESYDNFIDDAAASSAGIILKMLELSK